jgi:outer membrane autotransporter protein
LQITPHRSSNLSALSLSDLQARSEEEDRILDLETRLKSTLREKEAAEARLAEVLAESAQAKIDAEDSKRAIDATRDAPEAQRIAIEEISAKELTALAAQIPEEVLIIERAVEEAGNITPETDLGAGTPYARGLSEAPSNPNLQKMTSNDLMALDESNVTIAENIESQPSLQDHAKKHSEHSHHLSNSIMSSAHQSSSVISSHVDARVTSSDIEGLSAGDETIDKHLWIKVFGTDAKQKSSGSMSAFKSQQRGMIMGADLGLMDDYLILGFAYTKGFWKSKLQGKLAGDGQKVENDIGAIYARYSLTDKLFAGSQLAYGKTKIKTLHSGNNAKTTGNIFNANLDLGYIITIAGKILFVPKVGLGYNWLKINGFYDYGNGSYISRIGAKESNRLSSNVGFSLKTRYLIKEMNFVPEIHLGIDHMIKSKTNSVQISIIDRGQETSSIVNPINNHKNSYAIGGSLSVYRNDMVRVTAGYDYRFKPGCKSHSGYGRIALKF